MIVKAWKPSSRLQQWANARVSVAGELFRDLVELLYRRNLLRETSSRSTASLFSWSDRLLCTAAHRHRRSPGDPAFHTGFAASHLLARRAKLVDGGRARDLGRRLEGPSNLLARGGSVDRRPFDTPNRSLDQTGRSRRWAAGIYLRGKRRSGEQVVRGTDGLSARAVTCRQSGTRTRRGDDHEHSRKICDRHWRCQWHLSRRLLWSLPSEAPGGRAGGPLGRRSQVARMINDRMETPLAEAMIGDATDDEFRRNTFDRRAPSTVLRGLRARSRHHA